MKKYFIILGLSLFFIPNSFGADIFYRNYPSNSIRAIKRPVYNPYSNSYNYRRYYNNDTKKLERLNKIRTLNRIRNNISTWNNNNNFNNGTLTGYSLPISKNVFSQMNLNPIKSQNNFPSINTNTNLFSTPTNYGVYYDDGRYIEHSGGISGTTGVKIIYD